MQASLRDKVLGFFIGVCTVKSYFSFIDIHVIYDGGLPLITYAPRGEWGGGGVMPPIHFHCVLHAKKRGGGSGYR